MFIGISLVIIVFNHWVIYLSSKQASAWEATTKSQNSTRKGSKGSQTEEQERCKTKKTPCEQMKIGAFHRLLDTNDSSHLTEAQQCLCQKWSSGQGFGPLHARDGCVAPPLHPSTARPTATDACAWAKALRYGSPEAKAPSEGANSAKMSKKNL